MNSECTSTPALRLDTEPTTGLPCLYEGDQDAPPDAVFVRASEEGEDVEAWVQVRNSIAPESLYACCYLYRRNTDSWELRDDLFLSSRSLDPSDVPEPVRAACAAFVPSLPAAVEPRPVNESVTEPNLPLAHVPAARGGDEGGEPATLAERGGDATRTESPPRVSAGDEILRLEGHRYWIECVAIAPDGRTLVSGSGQPIGVGQSDFDFTVRLWDLDSGRELRGFTGHSNWVTSVAYSPHGRRVLSGSYDGTVRLWDLESGRELRRFQGHQERIRSVAFAPDGRHLLSGGYDRTVRLWDADSGRELHCYRQHEHWVMSVAFSPDGRLALSGGYDQRLCLRDLRGDLGESGGMGGRLFGSVRHLWNAARGRERRQLLGHTQTVTSVAFSPDGRQLLSGSVDKTLRLWDVAAGKEMRCFRGHTAGVTSVAFSPDGRRMVSGSLDETVRLWEVATGQEIHCFRGHADVVTSVAIAPDGRSAASGSADKTIRLWRLPG